MDIDALCNRLVWSLRSWIRSTVSSEEARDQIRSMIAPAFAAQQVEIERLTASNERQQKVIAEDREDYVKDYATLLQKVAALEAEIERLTAENADNRLNDDWLHARGGKWSMDGACWRFRHSWNTVNVRVNGQCWITSSCTYGGKVSLHRRLESCEEFSELCRLFGMPLADESGATDVTLEQEQPNDT